MSWILALGEARSLGGTPPEFVRPVAAGILLGLGAAIPIGPVNVEIARRALRHGFSAGVALGLGAVTVDVFYAVVSTLSFTRVLNQPTILLIVTAGGAFLLAYLGIQCLRAARTAWRNDPLAVLNDPMHADTAEAEAGGGAATRRAAHSAYLTGLLMTLLNPMTLAFWFSGALVAGRSVGSAAMEDAQIPKAAAHHLPMICAGVFIGTAAWVFTFSGLLAWASSRTSGSSGTARRRRWLALADAAGGTTLLAFAALAFLRLVQSL
jgi:threonine/homoserine/homoserine lactone efflux protein